MSILWVNYNSSSVISLVLESLQAVKDLNYPNYELVVVDNGSVDGSNVIVSDFIKQIDNSKFIVLDRNLGYTGGNNVAFANRDPRSKYVVLLNNDAVPRKESLRKMVDLMEIDETLGAAQGVILNHDEKSIDTAGDYLDELFGTNPLLYGKPPESLKKPVYITSADGAYSIHRVQAIKKTRDGNNNMFDDFVFACLDDYLLGLELWNNGYKVRAFPVVTAKHSRGTSFNRVYALRAYLLARNMIILNEISNSRYRNLIGLLFLKQLYGWFMWRTLGLEIEQGSRKLPALLSRALLDGTRIGRRKRRLGKALDMYMAPILRIDYATAFLGFMIRQRFVDSRIRKELDKIAR